MRILITGGCGFIGSHLAEYHLNKGDEVLVIDDLSTGSLNNIIAFKNHLHFKFEEADVTNWKPLNEVVESIDRIYHMAAVLGLFRVIADPIKVLSSNILGFHSLLNAVSNSTTKPRTIIASTSSVYGLVSKEYSSESDNLIIASTSHPLAGYAVSKIAGEILSNGHCKEHQSPVTIVRLFNTIGPRQTGNYGMVVPRFVKQACSNEDISVFGDGKQTRSFCDVRDTILALDLLASTSKSIGEVINVGQPQEITINDLAELVLQKANSTSDIHHISYKEAYGIELRDVRNRKPDLTKLYSLTNFKHHWTLDKTIEELIFLEYLKQKSQR